MLQTVRKLATLVVAAATCLIALGCRLVPANQYNVDPPPAIEMPAPPGRDIQPAAFGPPPANVPLELKKQTIPAYVIEPPDVLLVQVNGPAGQEFPKTCLAGEHVVRMDGTVNLGTFGSVRVAGLTTDQAREVIGNFVQAECRNKPSEAQQFELNVDVSAYHSKVYYVITDEASGNQKVSVLPFTGNETVLDALGKMGDLPFASSQTRIWVSRPSSATSGQGKVLPVEWTAITKRAAWDTNYQIFPGDRIYIQAER